MKRRLLEILREIERRIPPPENCHHALMLAHYGSDVEGWEEKLGLQINVLGVFHAFFLDEEDFDKSPELLSDELFDLLKQKNPAAQLGVALGQFVK